MPRSSGSERHSVPSPPDDGARATDVDPIPGSEPESPRDVAQEDFLFHLYRGSELLQENRAVEAKEELEFALTMQPLNPKGQDLLGAVYFRLGLYPRAIQIYETLSAQFARDVSIKVNLALAYLKTGQLEPASQVLREAVRLNPDHKRAWGYLGLAHQKLGEFAQAQVAFARGGHALMAKRAIERGRSLGPISSPPTPLDGGVRAFAEAAFLELDTGDLRFSLAEPEARRPSEGQWHTLELGEPVAASPRDPSPSRPFPLPRNSTAKAPAPEGRPPSASTLDVAVHVAEDGADSAPEAFAATRLVPPPLTHVPTIARMPSRPTGQPVDRSRAAPPLFDLPSGGAIGLSASGLLFVRTGEEPARAFAGRLGAIRAMGGTAATRVLHRRSRDADTNEVLGGVGSPLVRIAGDVEIVLGPRPAHELVLLTLQEDLAFLREDRLLGFEMALAYENGRVSLEPLADGARPAAEGTAIVQLRGTGTFVVEVAGKVASLASTPGRPLIVRREWVVGWFGRLVSRALSPADSPTGQRGLIRFAGDGLILLAVG